MALPFFYVPALENALITLDEDTSKHMIGVLRMEKGEEVLLTNGKGQKATAEIVDDNRKRCMVQVQNIVVENAPTPPITVAISLVKNASRFEWFLEKATEIGVSEIVPLLCDRTEKEKFRHDRMNGILVSAMLQSQQSWLPVLHEPSSFESVVKNAKQEARFIAHCLPEEKTQLLQSNSQFAMHSSRLILIGPEGDFTEKEISLALENKFAPVALGNTRLRTETAGMVAATLLRIG